MRFLKISIHCLKGALMACLLQPALASAEFATGPVVENFGAVADVVQSVPLTGKERFKVVFDAAEQGEEGKRNRKFESLARFLNMQARAGVKPEQIELALVVHGGAGFDVVNSAAFQKKFQRDNPNAELLAALQKHKVRVILCGQSAAFNGIENDDLLPGVEMALSAMTAHALLQQQGYTLNPW
ncbi:DsrE family protein [Microbulbifer pacificus]|uniref:DsrE family protein n=1 Tax=Microbulbifer pacificus TaxID=407164 RepID=A0AAU0MVY9_9GAMM|nr:DsrE family protein [Microbulbifer pacificus]WOX04349.1 DsrE family protein [Microbulbifer pacificus]